MTPIQLYRHLMTLSAEYRRQPPSPSTAYNAGMAEGYKRAADLVWLELVAQRPKPAAPTMSLDEFIRTGLDNLIIEAAVLAAANAETPEEAAAIPSGFFGIAARLKAEWGRMVREGQQ